MLTNYNRIQTLNPTEYERTYEYDAILFTYFEVINNLQHLGPLLAILKV